MMKRRIRKQQQTSYLKMIAEQSLVVGTLAP